MLITNQRINESTSFKSPQITLFVAYYRMFLLKTEVMVFYFVLILLSYNFKPLNMTFIEQLEALERLHLLIQRKATGTPEQLAERLNVCPRTIRNLIQILKHKDLSVHYSRDLQTYYYESDVEVLFFYIKRVKIT
jgi:HTH domain